MKQYLHLFSIMLMAGALAFTGCKDDENLTPGEWDAVDGYANIAFVESSTTEELDPADPTSITLHMSRRNTQGAISVPIEILSGDEDIFSVSNADFADGDSIVPFVISFPNAEVGTTYTVQVGVTDPKYTSLYSQNIYTTYTVTRVKWSSLGMGHYVDAWFGSEQDVEIFQNDSKPNLFRVATPYSEYDGDDYFLLGGETDEFLTLTIGSGNIVTFTDYFTGNIHPNYSDDVIALVHPYRLGADQSYNRVLSYQDDKVTPGQIQLAPYYYMFNYGGWNYSNRDGVILITFPGYVAEVPAYEAKFEDDFTWADVKTFDFTNTLTGASSNVMLQKATCTVSTDDADSVFLATYGVPYRIKDAYAEDYDIVFFVKGSKVYVPEDLEDYVLQPTGVTLDFIGSDVWAYIDSENSSIEFTEDGEDISSVSLGVVFTNEDFNVEYGEGQQTLANITWTKIATGTFYYNFFTGNEDKTPEADPGYELLKRDDKDNQFQIAEWLFGEDGFYFSWNRQTNECVVADQPTYYNHPSYGMIYIMEGADYHPNYAENKSYYDPETKTFHFFPAYYVAQGSFGQFEEVFEITEEGAVKHRGTFKLNKRKSLKLKNATQWKGLNRVKAAKAYNKRALRLDVNSPVLIR